MDKGFELETARLVIRPLSEDDFEKVYALQSNPEVMRYIGKGPRTEDQIKNLFELMLKHQEKFGFCLCPAFEKETDAFIGFAGLIHLALDPTNPEVEVGYWFLPEFWGKGYATELAKASVEWAFDNLPLDVVVGITHPDHVKSQHVLQKAGLRPVGKFTYSGREVDRFEVHKDDFLKTQ